MGVSDKRVECEMRDAKCVKRHASEGRQNASNYECTQRPANLRKDVIRSGRTGMRVDVRVETSLVIET
jgi:hypothetical protein